MEKFVHLRNDHTEEIFFHNIPFRVTRDKVITRLPGGNRINLQDPPVNGSASWNLEFPYRCECLFFLGMSTENWSCSEWWGQQENFFDHSARLFIGDKIGRIKVIYKDETEDLFPVIFGVNCWHYPLFCRPHDYEGLPSAFAAPYDEPFRSDPKAGELLNNSLKIMENKAQMPEGGVSPVEKNSKWIFGVKVDAHKDIQWIQLIRDESKRADFSVSAITGLIAGNEIQPDWIITDLDFYLKKSYYRNMDALARRLYQYEDEIPENIEKLDVADFDAPDIEMKGSNLAEIYTNIYRRNIMDMAHVKIEADGHVNVSSTDKLDYGCYIGFGTYTRIKGRSLTWTRDAGRSLTETARFGYWKQCKEALRYLIECLYLKSPKFDHPMWKRIADADPEDAGLMGVCRGKENDGHAAIMLFIYNMYNSGNLDLDWMYANRKALYDSADFFLWQSRNPEVTNFDRLLFSETEASTQTYGGYDLFSNLYAVMALRGYGKMFKRMAENKGGTEEDAQMCIDCEALANQLYEGCGERFTMDHPRYGDVYTDTLDDCWTYEYKRFADLFLRADIDGYDLWNDMPEIADKADRSFKAQREIYYNPKSGRQMGYGQGYLTETVLLLDRFTELTDCVNATAMLTYHHSDEPYMVPEGVIMHGTGSFWYRQSDLGNSVQQGEVIKIFRLIMGIDDLSRDRGLRLIPRLPDTWGGYSVKDFNVTDRDFNKIPVSLSYDRVPNGYELKFKTPKEIEIDYIRVGPFYEKPTEVTLYKEEHKDPISTKFEIRKIQDRYFAYVPIGGFVQQISLVAVV